MQYFNGRNLLQEKFDINQLVDSVVNTQTGMTTSPQFRTSNLDKYLNNYQGIPHQQRMSIYLAKKERKL